jgi:hypothetical protein
LAQSPESQQTETAPTINGWIEWASQFHFGNGYNEEYVIFNTPYQPQNWGSQTLFFFDGLQPNGPSAYPLIQPVIQWGSSAAGNCNVWGIYCGAAWWLTSGSNYYYSNLVAAFPGDQMWMRMIVTGVNGSTITWNIMVYNLRIGASVSINFNTTAHFYYATPLVLEAYNVTSCSHFPVGPGADVVPYSIVLATPGASWTTYNPVTFSASGHLASPLNPNCGFDININQSTQYVQLLYN